MTKSLKTNLKNSLMSAMERLVILSETYKMKDAYVVESENHVNVGQERGLNGTSFTVKSVFSSCYAVVYNTREEAEKYGADYYLLEYNMKPIHMRFIKASEFFSRELKEAEELMKFVTENEK